MSKNILDLRFCVKRLDGYVSSLWRLWATRHGDVYLTVKHTTGQTSKFSFHQSGICRSAFTQEYIEKHGMPEQMDDRAIVKWKRKETPVIGNGEFSRVAWLAFPTNFLSRATEIERKKVTWIDAAPNDGATYVELGYTSESEKVIREILRSSENRKLIHYTRINDKEALLTMYYHSDWKNEDLYSPTSSGSIFPNILFSANDPENTGRPIRITLHVKPRDGEELILQELGGYEVDSSVGR